MHDTAASDLEDLPVDVDAVRFEDRRCVVCDGLVAAGGEREDGRSRPRETDPKQPGVGRGGDIGRDFRQPGNLQLKTMNT